MIFTVNPFAFTRVTSEKNFAKIPSTYPFAVAVANKVSVYNGVATELEAIVNVVKLAVLLNSVSTYDFCCKLSCSG